MQHLEERAAVRLPINRAFVVQLAAGGALLGGRVEHLNSGRVGQFASFGELTVFLEGVLVGLPETARDPTAYPHSPSTCQLCHGKGENHRD